MVGDALQVEKNKSGLYFLCIGAFFIMLSLSTHLPAYPHILGKFQLDAGYAVFMQLGLALGLTGFQPLLGWAGDSFGIRKVVILGAAFMIVGSVVVATAPTFWLVVVGLFFKGLASSAIAPSGVAYAGNVFTGDERGKAIGLFAATMTLGALFGPLISGLFVDSLGWESSFWLTAVLGAASLVLYNVGVPKLKVGKTRSLDIPGVIFVLIVLVSILTIPTFVSQYGFNSGMWLPSLGIFVVTLILLIVIEKKQKEPLLDIQYTASKRFWVPTMLASLILVGYSGVMYLLTFFVQDVQGKSATTVGLLQMVIFLGSTLSAIISGKIMAKFNSRIMLAVGLGMFSIALIMLTTVNINTSFSYLLLAMALLGVGSSFLTPILKAIVLSKADPTRINVVTFTNNVIENLCQRLGASFSLVAFAAFAARGDGVSALSSTTWIFIALVVVAFLLLVLIPKKIEGIHDNNKNRNSLLMNRELNEEKAS